MCKKCTFVFPVTGREFPCELLASQRAERRASSSGSHSAFSQGSNCAKQWWGCHRASCHPCALPAHIAWSLQVTAMSTFSGLLTPCTMAHNSWLHGDCPAALGTTLGRVGLWGLSQASCCQLRGLWGLTVIPGPTKKRRMRVPSAPNSLGLCVSVSESPSPVGLSPRSRDKEPLHQNRPGV